MSAVRFFLAFIGFFALYALVDWFAGVAAPVIDPAFLIGLIVFLFWLMVRLYKAAK